MKKITSNADEPLRFQRVFISYAAQKQGFLGGCRPFTRVDRCHLKGFYKGVLLSVVSIDANGEIFPLAFAMVEGENKQSLIWFFNNLKLYIGEGGQTLGLS